MRIARMHPLPDRESPVQNYQAERCSNVNYRTTFRQGVLRNSVPGGAGGSFDKTVCLAGSLSPSLSGRVGVKRFQTAPSMLVSMSLARSSLLFEIGTLALP